MKKRTKSGRILSFSGPYFPAFVLNKEDALYLSVFSPNAGKYGLEKLRIWTLEAHLGPCQISLMVSSKSFQSFSQKRVIWP